MSGREGEVPPAPVILLWVFGLLAAICITGGILLGLLIAATAGIGK